ncbi:MAG: DNA cytosine methyltransferase [Vicinamibacteria bacterium]|nr:DNA cytosine methyltransferase [Vicinamibacteria bacterium]
MKNINRRQSRGGLFATKRSPDELDLFRSRLAGATRKGKPYRLIDLFCGAGGMSLGFVQSGHGFKPIWANDFDSHAAATYNQNFGAHCTNEDIVDVLADPAFTVPAADVVIGGPPCQGFSLLNKGRAIDPRKQLWRPFMDVVERSGASIFVMENVPQLLNSVEHGEIAGVAEQMGFKLDWAALCAADYGVPQVRWRAFIIGSKSVEPSTQFPPRRTHVAADRSSRRAFKTDDIPAVVQAAPYQTVRDAIGDLPRPSGTEIKEIAPPLDLHFGRQPTEKSLKRYKAIPREGMNRFDLQRNAPELTPACWIRKTSGGTDLFGRLWWDRPSVTIRTEFYKPEKGRYLHPQQHRPITHREAARLQSFPDEFRFLGTKIEVAKQIGNAVPPVLASRIADCVAALLLTR